MKTVQNLNVLERDDLERLCPSFYATAPKEDVSDKYTFLNTRDISLLLLENNWYPVSAREQRSNKSENRGFTKHIVRWANPEFALNGQRIEIVGTNSHNRSSAFSLMAGIFRLVCSNGLIAQTGKVGSFKVRHKGDITHQVLEAVNGISSTATQISHRINDFQTIDMSPDEQGVFAAAAHQYIYDEPEKAPISPEALLAPKRYTDRKDEKGAYGSHALPKPDLWTTFNVVQENIMKGGVKGYNREKFRRVTTRKITSIDKDVKLNKALWTLTEKFAELKSR